MQKNQVQNYQKELDRVIRDIPRNFPDGRVPRLYLHSCCAPCSSYVLEYLSQYFKITDFYYNPNIYPPQEYKHRTQELRRLISQMHTRYPVDFEEGSYVPQDFYSAVRGYEKIPEGGERCFRCYELRMRESARRAAEGKYNYFTTTLSISPLKNAGKINEIGERLAREYGVRHLPSDFKKRGGYQRSIQLSHEYNLYRQDYCGCIFSQKEREEQKRRKAEDEPAGQIFPDRTNSITG